MTNNGDNIYNSLSAAEKITPDISGLISNAKTKLYDKSFYESQKSLSLSSAEQIVPIIIDILNPSSVIDFGCGAGTWLSVFENHKVKHIQGLEINNLSSDNYFIEKEKIINNVNFASKDFNISGNYDLAVCLETAEHIHIDYAENLIKNLTSTAPAVLFSAAFPGQTGINHINEQTLSFWRNIFAFFGFSAIDCIRPLIQTNFQTAWWYRQNIIVFVSNDLIKSNAKINNLHKIHSQFADSQNRIAYISEWILEKQQSAAQNASNILFETAHNMINSGNLSLAAKMIEIILSLEIKNQNLYKLLSDLYSHLGENEKSVFALEKSNEYINPEIDNYTLSKIESSLLMESISIIIPTYNRAESLRELLDSICLIEYPQNKFEILVIDNNSNDNTESVCSEYINKLANLKYFIEKEPGLHAGRHKGLVESKNDILLFCDDDIIVTPEWLHAANKSFKNKDVMLAAGKILPKFESPVPEWVNTLWNRSEYGISLGWYTLLDFGDQSKFIPANYVWGANFAVRKEAVIDAGGFHPDSMPANKLKFRGDGESGLAKKIAGKGGKAFYNPSMTVYHKVSAQRLSLEYIYKRGFAQGISDSYSAVRKSGKIMDFKNRADSDGTPNSLIHSAIIDGWNYHQKELRIDNNLLDWVIKENYFI